MSVSWVSLVTFEKRDLVRYYGGKGKLTPFIEEVLATVAPGITTISDNFAGTGAVGLALRKSGYKVSSNDIMYFASCLNVVNLNFTTAPFFQNLGSLENVLHSLNNLEGSTDFITLNYSPAGKMGRMFFTQENARRIDAIRFQIFEWKHQHKISSQEEQFLIGLLLKAINRVSNVTGTYAAYLKTWDARSAKRLELSNSDANYLGPQGSTTNKDIFELETSKTEVAYLDPPYNNRDYSSNYFLLEVIAKGWYENEFYPKGVTGLVPFPEQKSTFSSKRTAMSSFEKLLEHVSSDVVLLSYSNEGIVPISELESLFEKHGDLTKFKRQHKRFRSINQDGTKTQTNEHILVLKRESRG